MDKRPSPRSSVKTHRKQKSKSKYLEGVAYRYRKVKLYALALGLLVVLGIMVVTMQQWQDFGGGVYVIRTINQVMNRHSAGDGLVIPVRGTILDRNHQTLALSSITYNIIVDVRMLNGRTEREQLDNHRIFTDFFDMDAQELSDMLARDTHYFVIERGAPYSRKRAFEAFVAELDTVARENETRFFTRDIAFRGINQRSYIHNHVASPILGFYHGLWWGLEHVYYSALAGRAGRTMTVLGADGHITTQRIPPVNGHDVITTLDLSIQRYAEDLVVYWAGRSQAGQASVIVMNPHTGEVLAMAQYPSFDANAPSALAGLTSSQTEHLSELAPGSQEFFDELFRIWANFNITATFEPGSTYKSFTAAKALDAGVILPNQMFYCSGFKYVAGHRIHCWVFPRGHGHINLTQALAVSCNVAHMEIAATLGRDAFWRYQRDFGFGVITGIDLPGENPGLVFGRNELNDSELATSSFGQRFTVTPIQNITAFSALINGGNVVRPHVVKHILDDAGAISFVPPNGVQLRVIAPEVSDWMRRAMADVIESPAGTGRAAYIAGFTQGGKTATAEQGLPMINDVPNPDFSWSISYIGYFPLESPQYIIQVLLHEIPPEVYDAGFRSAVPMHRQMMEEIIRLHSIPPCNIIQQGNLPETEFVPDLIGLGVQEAMNQLNIQGRPFDINSSGNIVQTQFPPAGVRAALHTPVTLHLQNNESLPIFPVPTVTGQPVDFAREILLDAGFVPRVVHTVPGGDEVYAQLAENLMLPAGTEILIFVR
ncbi:MAG: penicillin-binding transpeptidase domain-containing protein [Defluviitaleaceae bacterium]|nr:penicillin-binding transpeptidase domain-containing protein [Defluviitaleaceae bacterium]